MLVYVRARTRPFQFSLSLFRGVAEGALYCPHRAIHRSSIFSLEGGLNGLPLRATFSPAHPLARRDVP